MAAVSEHCSERVQFFDELQQSITLQQLSRLTLSKYHGAEPALQQLQVRLITLKQQPYVSLLYRYKTNDITRNLPPAEAITLLDTLIGQEFKNAHLYTSNCEIQLTCSKKGKYLYQRKNQQTNVEQSQQHNREKQRYLTLERPFLTALGITDKQHQLIPAMSRKWKQINKFIEIFSGALHDCGLQQQQNLHIADFGSGKAYLTFAVHDYLTHSLELGARITGVELRQPLVDLCNQTAASLQLQGIQFEQGDVKHFKAQGINVMIALHACDTATDYAIHMGIVTGAEMIMCSPCCHKEIRPQINVPSVLRPMLQHGIHLAQEAEMLTDSLRALLLEAHGYDTKVFEFISLEHTSKNKMILATKRKTPRDNRDILRKIHDLKVFYGIDKHCLETLLALSQDT